jgi:hypothetical protein
MGHPPLLYTPSGLLKVVFSLRVVMPTNNNENPPGPPPEDAAAGATKAAATWVVARQGITAAYRVLNGFAEAVEAFPLVQFVVGETGGVVKMLNTKFLQHGCVSPLDF